jgi:uncharacterized protein YcnI
MKTWMTALPVFLLTMIVFAGIASAHVKVYPQQVVKGTYETFTVNVPSEKEKAKTTKVKVMIPNGVTISGVEPKPGWQDQLNKDNTGKITSITWKAEDDGLSPGEFTELKMQGKVEDNAKKLTFKAYQTYSDGSVVKWIEDEESDHPASVTKVVAAADDDRGDTSHSLGLAFYFSIAALILGIIAIVVATMKKKT